MYTMDQLQAELTQIFGDAVEKVYTQPPTGTMMKYPSVTIERDVGNTAHADNSPYRHLPRYLLTGISRDSDEGIYKLLASLPTSRHERTFVADNLIHDVFTMSFADKEEEDS